ncbi:protein-export chaperone SecB [Asaia krungthepensis]|uniref:Protein translocase subunit SecB n=1 Tax=Asaia krungthepensis NRIC 0535 TaxID=1307925 RepID=A0ABQ0PW93_9PROT|nr:protein-export chaperone SecB [Asaia krungthepensis]GBQ83208.1 protein translocase subunit SecB [Asaia krungthepensis NRIC 0535]
MPKRDSVEKAGRTDQAPLETLLVSGAHYLKSSSMTSIGTPEVFFNLPARPHIGLRIDVNARQLGEDQPNFEVNLTLQGAGYRTSPTTDAPEPESLYRIELVYSGVFTVQNARSDMLEALLLVEAPRQLFPSARHLLLTFIRESGFPVTNIQPVDFHALMLSRQAQL